MQYLHEKIADSAGFGVDRRLTASWPAPSLTSGPVALPYCDNLTIIGICPEKKNAGLRGLMSAFERVGFSLHEVEMASMEADVLAGTVLGQKLHVIGKRKTIWKVRAALQYLIGQPVVTGRQLEVLLGHYIPPALFNRGLLSPMRALYSFVQDSYETPVKLWASAAYEAWIMSSLLPLSCSNLALPWDQCVLATDASLEGFGVCEGEFPRQLVQDCGQWRDRWRFKRLPPSEWAPRLRVLGDLDVLSDPRTVEGFDPDISHHRWEQRTGFPEVPADILKGPWRVGDPSRQISTPRTHHRPRRTSITSWSS